MAVTFGILLGKIKFVGFLQTLLEFEAPFEDLDARYGVQAVSAQET